MELRSTPGVSRGLSLALLALLCLALTSCGGGDSDENAGAGSGDNGTKTYEGDGFSFTYPEDWVELEVDFAGFENEEVPNVVSVGPESGIDALAVRHEPAPFPMTEADLAQAKEELEPFVRQAVDYGEGRVISELAETTLAGMPALVTEISGSIKGHPARLRLTFAWDGRTHYQVNCQYAQSHAEEMTAGCDQVLESFEVE